MNVNDFDKEDADRKFLLNRARWKLENFIVAASSNSDEEAKYLKLLNNYSEMCIAHGKILGINDLQTGMTGVLSVGKKTD